MASGLRWAASGWVGIALLVTSCANGDVDVADGSGPQQEPTADPSAGVSDADADHEALEGESDADAGSSETQSDDLDVIPDDDPPEGPRLSRTERRLSTVAVYQDGTRIELGLEIGAPVPASSLDEGGLSACNVNEERDVVMPALLTATPITTDFSYSVQAGVAVLTAPGHDAEVWSQMHSGRVEAACQGGSGGALLMAAVWGEMRADDDGEPRERSGRFSILVRDYYSPASPDGDDELLGGIALRFATQNSGLGGEATALEAPSGTGGVLWDGLPVLPLLEPHGFDGSEPLPSS